jgi:hypothetical protein
MSVSQKHPFHLVDPSPWPLLGSLGALASTIGGVMYMHSFLLLDVDPQSLFSWRVKLSNY